MTPMKPNEGGGPNEGAGAGPATPAREQLWLADWRRLVGALYAEVRARSIRDPIDAWDLWRTEREALYRGHPQSPVPVPERATFRARHWPYDAALRFVVEVEDDAPAGLGAPLALPNSGAETLAFVRLGRVTLPLRNGGRTLALYWMEGYAGGLFLPVRDGTSGIETYGAGRYLLDTAKGADLGGDAAAGTLVVDVNFAFQPSCAFDPSWSCPLAPPENRLDVRLEAGERLR
jgi:uncharacterized protein (DUF1684 family)